MSCSGLHCSGCAGGSVAPVVVLVALEGGAWLVTHLIEVLAVSAACGVLAVAAVAALMRWADCRDARHAALGPLLITREPSRPALTATVTPQVKQGTTMSAIENHYHIHFDPADREAARIIRAIPGIAGDAITKE